MVVSLCQSVDWAEIYIQWIDFVSLRIFFSIAILFGWIMWTYRTIFCFKWKKYCDCWFSFNESIKRFNTIHERTTLAVIILLDRQIIPYDLGRLIDLQLANSMITPTLIGGRERKQKVIKLLGLFLVWNWIQLQYTCTHRKHATLKTELHWKMLRQTKRCD